MSHHRSALAALSLLLCRTALAGPSPQQAQPKKLSEGPERCLSADSPFWCLAEETSAGLSRTFGARGITSADAMDAIGELASSALDVSGFSTGRAVDEESRSRRRRRFAFFIMAIASMFAILIPLKLKAIAVLAATALFVGKLALIIAALVGLKKLVHKQGEETTHVHYGHRSDGDAHYLAYSEHIPGPHYIAPEEKY